MEVKLKRNFFTNFMKTFWKIVEKNLTKLSKILETFTKALHNWKTLGKHGAYWFGKFLKFEESQEFEK